MKAKKSRLHDVQEWIGSSLIATIVWQVPYPLARSIRDREALKDKPRGTYYIITNKAKKTFKLTLPKSDDVNSEVAQLIVQTLSMAQQAKYTHVDVYYWLEGEHTQTNQVMFIEEAIIAATAVKFSKKEYDNIQKHYLKT